MPLRAHYNREDVLAFDLSPAQWDELRTRSHQEENSLTLPCCGAHAFLRKSSLGTQHFVHAVRGDCDGRPESAIHLRAKEQIVRAARAAGFEAITEATGETWRV